MILWFAQMMLNYLWSPVVFRLHSLSFGLTVILALLATVIGFVVARWNESGSRRSGVVYSLCVLGRICLAVELFAFSIELGLPYEGKGTPSNNTQPKLFVHLLFVRR